MSYISKIKVKICCISSSDEAQIAVRMGATAIGLVGKMPSGPGPISDEKIAKIAASLPPHIGSFLLRERKKNNLRILTPMFRGRLRPFSF